MNSKEFKAWFDGFSENIEGVPNKKQWAKIKERVKDISGPEYTPWYIFRDRYPWVREYWGPGVGISGATMVGGGFMSGKDTIVQNNGPTILCGQNASGEERTTGNAIRSFKHGNETPLKAFCALGKMDYKDVTAAPRT